MAELIAVLDTFQVKFLHTRESVAKKKKKYVPIFTHKKHVQYAFLSYSLSILLSRFWRVDNPNGRNWSF